MTKKPVKTNYRSLFREKVIVEKMSFDLDSSNDYLVTLLEQMNEFPDCFETHTINLKDGVLTQDINKDLLNEWFTPTKDLTLFKLNCIVDFSKTYPRIILYESYLHECFDNSVHLKEMKFQQGLFLIQDEKGITRLASCISSNNDFLEAKSLLVLWSRNLLLSFSQRLSGRSNNVMH